MPALAQVPRLSLSAPMHRVRHRARRRSRAARLRPMRRAGRADAGAALRNLRRCARVCCQRRVTMRPLPLASATLPNRAHYRTLSNHGRGRARQPARADSPSQVRPRSVGRARAGGIHRRRVAGVGRRLRRGHAGAAALAASMVARLQPGRITCRRSRAAARSTARHDALCRAGASPRRKPRNITTNASEMCAARSPSRIPSRVRNRRVLIVDDVMTTGATVDECARVLLAAGAACVDVFTLARVL